MWVICFWCFIYLKNTFCAKLLMKYWKFQFKIKYAFVQCGSGITFSYFSIKFSILFHPSMPDVLIYS